MKERLKKPYPRIRGFLDPCPIHLGSAQTVTHKYNASDTTATSNQSIVIPSSPGLIMHDTVTPGFRKLQAEGKIINNGMSRQFNDYVIEPWSGVSYASSRSWFKTPVTGAFLSDESTWNSWLGFGPGYTFPAVASADISVIQIQASNEAIANSHQRDVLGIVDLAEGHKTIDLLTTNVHRLQNILNGVPLKKLGKAKFRKGSDIPMRKYKATSPGGKIAEASGLWLEYHYGILPTMMSIEGLMKVLMEQSKPKRQTYRGSASISDDITETTVVPFMSWFNSSKQIGNINYSTRYEYNVYTRAGILTEFQASLQGRLGMEMRDIPTAMYELIPFSFVLDWVYDLNTAIEAMTPVNGYSSLASWLTTVKEEIFTYTYERTGFSDALTDSTGITVATGYPLRTAVTLISRTKTRTPGLTARLPKLDLHFRSYTHAISALALAISIGHGKLNRRLKL